MPLVVDASVALAWALPDESSAYADAVLTAVEVGGLRVPELWAREVANGLAVAYFNWMEGTQFRLANSPIHLDLNALTSR